MQSGGPRRYRLASVHTCVSFDGDSRTLRTLLVQPYGLPTLPTAPTTRWVLFRLSNGYFFDCQGSGKTAQVGLFSIVKWVLFRLTKTTLVLLMALALTEAVPDSVDHLIASIVFAIIPVLLAIDLLGWGLRLRRLLSTIRSVEAGLERLRGTPDMGLPQVLRLVAEYNCQVVTGIPIHNRLYAQWCDEIRELWEQR